MDNQIKIGGQLYNVQDPKGTLANASQIATSDPNKSVEDVLSDVKSTTESVSGKVTELEERLDDINIDVTANDVTYGDTTVADALTEISQSVTNIRNTLKFTSEEEAEVALSEGLLTLGDMFTINIGASADALFTQDFKVYVIAEDKDKQLVIKELATGGGDDVVGTVTLDVTKIMIDGVDTAGAEILEANIGSKIDITYDFLSVSYPDALGTVVFRRGSTDIFRESVYPDGSSYNLPTYVVESSITPGTYQFSIYGQDKTKLQSKRTKYTIIIGGLSINHTSFNNGDVFKVGSNITIPFSVTAADETATVELITKVNGQEINRKSVKQGPDSVVLKSGTGTNLDVGVNKVELILENSKGKISNTLAYNVVIAEENVIYVTVPNETTTGAEGTRIELPISILQLNSKNETYNVDVKITDKNDDIIYNQVYSFKYGNNIIPIMNLLCNTNPYDVSITVSGTSEENVAKPTTVKTNILITANNYNIKYVGEENLICSFSAAGKSNQIVSERSEWIDKSSMGVKATLNNFNWITNGWINDDDTGDTALRLNSGAYVELDITPFKGDIAAGEAITFSIDFSTEDILDSKAKVVSCLKEQPGTDKNYYYLRDKLNEYIKHDDEKDTPERRNNIVNYFRNTGGYCWINGITYGTEENPVEPDVTYKTAAAVGERAINYNRGLENPSYNIDPNNGEIDYKKFTGYNEEKVTKEVGMYIDTQYAVLTNPASPANVLDKFYLNFSENTRTRIDFIITRIPGDSIGEVKNEKGEIISTYRKNPYCHMAMIGYINGVLSLMKALPENDSFAHSGKVYLGCKALLDANNNLSISETGSAKIYNFRIYNRALTHTEILNNYAASITDPVEKKRVIDNNGILSSSSIAQLPYMELIGYRYDNVSDSAPNINKYSIYKFIMQLLTDTGMEIADLKEIKQPAYIRYYDPVKEKYWGINSEWSDTEVAIPARLQFQGTSSMVYPIKNYKIRLHESVWMEGNKVKYSDKKIKKDIGNGNNESTFCLKADYMDSSHCNNTGSANFISDYNVLSGKTPASELDDSYRTTIYGFPILLYYRESLETPLEDRQFIGVYNLNLDKSCTGSFGFEDELEDADNNMYRFSDIRFIDDDASNDVLKRVEIPFSEDWEQDGEIEILVKEDDDQFVRPRSLYKLNGDPIAVKNGDIYYKLKVIDEKIYVLLENPATHIECALLTPEGFIKTIDGISFSSTQCFEFKANSGASGAGGFGSYAIDSISKDLENRYPDDGDLEEEQYAEYVEAVGTDNAINFTHYRSPLYYNIRRNIRWIKDASKDDFRANLYKYYDITYTLDYYLTIMLLGGVDSLGKNLMIASWGPENHLYEVNEGFDEKTFEYKDPYDGSIKFITPTKAAEFKETYEKDGVEKERNFYKYAKNSKGQHLYFKENIFNRYENKFMTKDGAWNQSIVTMTPGEGIQRPIFYDIDTINGLDNSGQLIFDCDIEIGDVLSDGTSVFNTDDSNLWGRIRDYMKDECKDRWNTLTSSGYFTLENLVGEFYHDRQIAKIPESSYNKDCFLKYIWEGPVEPDGKLPNGDIATYGSGSYLYCIHGSRYEHMKRWYKQRIDYITSMFGIMGSKTSSLRFNHALYDTAFKPSADYYASYAQLAQQYPDRYYYDATDGKLYLSKGGREILPITFDFKTYQPGYVGLRWSNNKQETENAPIIYYRFGRDETVTVKGNVGSSGDAEVFIFGGENIKEIGDMNRYNVKQIDFSTMKKISKIVLGGPMTSVIQKISLDTNTYLTELNVRNCTSLVQVDIKNCKNIRNVYMGDSKVSSITLPTGGALENIEYSDAIASINLEGFINLSTVTVGSLNNLTKLVIKDCPKILGTEELRSPKAWSLLQKTKNMYIDADTNVELTSYGDVEPVIYADGEYFFADSFWNIPTSKNIRGEISYKGNTIPSNYAKFKKAYPKLKISYPNIKDASGMFENYKNINTISTMKVKYGEDASGDKMRTVYYWIDDTPELQAKWHTQEMYDKYGYSSTHSYTIGYYQANGTFYRLLNVYDDEDLDGIRQQIKENLSIFNGGRFTNIDRMFKGMDILDYIDPDTFNEIDLSGATSNELFSGCTALKYFTLPNDIIKNRPVYKYYDSTGMEVPEVDWDSTTGTKEHKTNASGELLYENDLSGETTSETSVYKKGLRNIGENAFYECRDARILIKKLSNTDRIVIEPTAFKYILFNPSLENQEKSITCQRPSIMFEHSDIELLKTSDITSTYPVGDGRYFTINENKEREINFENSFINFKNSNNFLREVYFGVEDIIINESINDTEKISYGKTKDGMKILFDVTTTKDELLSFNVDEDEENYLKIKAVTQAAFYNIASKCVEIEAPLANYDCLDTSVPRQDYEGIILSLFSKSNFTSLEKSVIDANKPRFSKFNIVNTSAIPFACFRYMRNIEYISADDSLTYIGDEAFKESSVIRLSYLHSTSEISTLDLKINEVGISAFENCDCIKIFRAPETLAKLNEYAFRGCQNLEIVYMNDIVTEIPQGCFAECIKLNTFNGLSKNTTKIGSHAFRSCTLLPLIGSENSAVFGSSIGNYTLLEHIGDSAFERCNELTAGLPANEYAIRIEKFEVPSSLKVIGNNAFAQELGRASEMFIEFIWNGNYADLSIGNGAFLNIRTAWKPEGYAEPITDIIYVPTVRNIGSNAFKSRTSDTSFKLAFTDMPDIIGNNWVSEVAKIIFSYAGMSEIDNITYIFSDDGTNKFAYMQYINMLLTKLDVPVSVSYNSDEYFLKEILKGALEKTVLSNIVFKDPETYGAKLDTIETGVLISSSLIGIITRYKDGDGFIEKENIIPDNIRIATGNILKNTSWFEIVANSGYVTLGKYIIGYKPASEDEIVASIDVSGLTNCNIIYDNAFNNLKDLVDLNLGNVTEIYSNAFSGCTSLVNINLPRTLTTIGSSAFIDCPVKELFIPNTITNMNGAPFGSQGLKVGTIESVIIEDGSTIKSLPFVITKEIKTNGKFSEIPTEANITVKRLHIPASMAQALPASELKALSQVCDLTIGNLKVNDDGSYLFDNYPLYRDTDGNLTAVDTEGYDYATDDAGNRLYCPRFYYDIMVAAGYPSSIVSTTRSKDYYPLGDIYNEDGELISSGYCATLDIRFIMKYEDPMLLDGVNLDLSKCRDLTAEDIFRIVAGFTSTGSNVFPVKLRKTDFNKLSLMEKLALSNYRILFEAAANM